MCFCLAVIGAVWLTSVVVLVILSLLARVDLPEPAFQPGPVVPVGPLSVPGPSAWVWVVCGTSVGLVVVLAVVVVRRGFSRRGNPSLQLLAVSGDDACYGTV
jgi:hypothetical protein